MSELPHSRSCFVCGSRNPIGLNLRFFTDGQIARARFMPQPQHSGFVGVIHGGLLATILDEIMVWACAVRARQFCYCAEMTVRYLSPARPSDEILAVAWLSENKRNRILLAEGELTRADGSRIATSTGKYMPVKNVDLTAWLDDFEGTPEQLQQLPGANFARE